MPTRIQAHQWDGLHPYGLWADIPPAAETPSFKCVEVNMRLLTPPFWGSKNCFAIWGGPRRDPGGRLCGCLRDYIAV